MEVAGEECGTGCLSFFGGLCARGLSGVLLVTSDAHQGLVSALGATPPGAYSQRCRTHHLRDLLAKAPKPTQPWVATLLRTIFDQPDAAELRAQFQRVVGALESKLPEAASHLDEGEGRPLGLRRLSPRALAPGVVEQPAGVVEPRDPPVHRCRGHVPRSRRRRPPHRRRPRRAA